MCFRIAETMESPQEVETTGGNHENCHFQANLSQNPGWTPRSNHGRLETTAEWKPWESGNHRRVDTTKGWIPHHFQANLSQNPGWTPQSNHEKPQEDRHHRVTRRVETMGGWKPGKSRSNHREGGNHGQEDGHHRVTTGEWKPWEGGNHGRETTEGWTPQSNHKRVDTME